MCIFKILKKGLQLNFHLFPYFVPPVDYHMQSFQILFNYFHIMDPLYIWRILSFVIIFFYERLTPNFDLFSVDWIHFIMC